MKQLLMILLLLCFVGCSKQVNANEHISNTTTEETTIVTTTPKITTIEQTTITSTTPVTTTQVTTTKVIATTTSKKTTAKPVTTTTKNTTTTPLVTTTGETTPEVTTTVDTEPPVITPYIYKKGELTKSLWMITHESYTIYQSSKSCKWYKDGEQMTNNYVSSFVVKEGRKEISLYCVDENGNTSKTINQKLKITQTPKLEYVAKDIDGKQTLIVYANEPVYFIVNGRKYSSLKTKLELTNASSYDIGAIDEEGHESAHFEAYIRSDDVEVVTTTDCGCTIIP